MNSIKITQLPTAQLSDLTTVDSILLVDGETQITKQVNLGDLSRYTSNSFYSSIYANSIIDSGSTGRSLLLSTTADLARMTLERQDFTTRAAFVAWVVGKTFTVGLVMRAAGMAYRYKGSGTAISDLPGWIPDNYAFLDHWNENISPSVTDMTAAFIAAVAYIKTTANVYRGRDALYLQGKAYLISGQIVIDFDFFSLHGVGTRGSYIHVVGNFGDVFKFQKADTSILLGSISISNVSLRAFSTRTYGVGIGLYGCQGVWLTNVAVDDFFQGICVQGGSNQWWNGVTVHGVRQTYKAADMTGSYYVKFEEGVTTNLYNPQNIYMTGLNCEFNDSGVENVENGIIINCCDGLWFQGGHSQGVTSSDILIEPKVTTLSPSGSQITSIISSGFWCDSNSDYGIRVRGNSINNNGHVFTGHRWLTNRIYSLWIEPSCNIGTITFNGGQLLKAGLSGMRIEDGYSVIVNGMTFSGCGSSLTTERYGVHLAGTARNVLIDGCIFTNTVGPNEITLNCSAGVYVANDTVDKITVTNCHFEGMTGLWDIDDNKVGKLKTYRHNTTSRAATNVTATSGSLTINALQDYFKVASSVTSIANLTHRHRNRVVTLEFTAPCTVLHSIPYLYLVDGDNAYFNTGDTIRLQYTGSYWLEVGRRSSNTTTKLAIADTTDPTKNFKFSATGITTNTTRTLTIPNASGVIALLSGIAQSFANSVTFNNIVSFALSMVGTSQSSRLGYGVGAGNIITQLSSKSTAVSIPYPTGLINTHTETLAAGASVQFTVINTTCTSEDIPIISIQSPSSKYIATVSGVSAGSFVITLKNDSTSPLTEQVLINFAIFKGSSS